ncbi:uncharacterized protein RJT20DRAFT_137339 [Scheffersomyces xylosifermentans]|uniref:uncharacterized protein n=1 Tax=Scheffersomyces xylosifermentans TaxID=1304137 RepID=UPI00315D322E
MKWKGRVKKFLLTIDVDLANFLFDLDSTKTYDAAQISKFNISIGYYLPKLVSSKIVQYYEICGLRGKSAWDFVISEYSTMDAHDADDYVKAADSEFREKYCNLIDPSQKFTDIMKYVNIFDKQRSQVWSDLNPYVGASKGNPVRKVKGSDPIFRVVSTVLVLVTRWMFVLRRFVVVPFQIPSKGEASPPQRVLQGSKAFG